jgi:iron complex transport system ATP-binding protein
VSLQAEGASAAIAGRLVVDGVSIEVAAGSLTALIGPNGAGKSTLIRVLSGVAAPSAGRVLFNGTDWAATPRRERARLVALVEQSPSTELAITVRDTVALSRTPYRSLLGGESADDSAVIDAALATTRTQQFADRELSTLSGGERQRVQLARALAQQPRLLLLDEPTSHLDIAAQLEVMQTLRMLASDGLAVLTALHDLNLATQADQVVVLAAGRVVAAGAPDTVLTSELLGEVYGVEASILAHPVTGARVIAFAAATPGEPAPGEPAPAESAPGESAPPESAPTPE